MAETSNLSATRQKLLELYLRGRKPVDQADRSVIKRRAAGVVAPLSLCQEQVWLHSMAHPGLAIYNESITIHRKGDLDRTVLERALAEIVARHEIWRTTFELVKGAPAQIVHPAPDNFEIPTIDLRHLPKMQAEAEAKRILNTEAAVPLDLQRGPLIRPLLVMLANREYQLLFIMHQCILDGVSAYQVFLSELVSLYEAFAENHPSPLPELPFQFSDYAIWEREWLGGGEAQRQISFWRKQLDGSRGVLNWPSTPRPPAQSFHGAIHPYSFDLELSSQVRLLSRREGVTLFTVLLAAFNVLLYGYTQQSEIVLGTVAPAGRERAQALLGYFLNPVPLRVNFCGDPSFSDLLKRVRIVLSEAIAHDNVPVQTLAKELCPPTDPTRFPFFQVATSLEPPLAEVDPSWSLTPMDLQNGGCRWDMYLVFDDRPTGIIGRVQYNPDLFDVPAIDAMLDDLRLLLKQIAARPELPISELLAACRGQCSQGCGVDAIELIGERA